MPTITSFAGETLLAPAVVSEIKNQTEILLKNKDVAGAFQAAAYLKAELAKLPAEKVKPVLDLYRAVNANLKVLALPLLEKEEVKNLLANNLPFVDAAFSDTLSPALSAWLSLQTEAEAAKIREELLAVLPAGNPLSEKIKHPAAEIAWPFGSRDTSRSTAISAAVLAAQASGNVGTGTDELFDADEASELASHAAKVNEMGGSPLPVDGASRLADEILSLRHPSPLASGGSLQTRPDPAPRNQFGAGIDAGPEDDKGQTPETESFKRRTQALVVSRLRDVRTPAEIRDYLSRPFAVGGLGLSGDNLEKALKLIEQEYQRLHASGPSRATSGASSSGSQEASIKSQGSESQSVNGQDKVRAALSVVSEVASPSPVIASVIASPHASLRVNSIPRSGTERSNPVANAMNVGIASVAPQTAGLPRNDKLEANAVRVVKSGTESSSAAVTASPRVARPAQTLTNGKPRLDDIKHPAAGIAMPFGSGDQSHSQPMSAAVPASQQGGNFRSGTVGAPDELKLLTLADWRSFGGGQAAVNHILEKVNILAKESLSEKIEAVSAFHQSPLFQEYVKIGQTALSSGMTLAEALMDAAVNPNKMTEEEFFAIAELNGKLK